MADPSDDFAAEAVALFVGRAVHRFVALPTDIEAALERLVLQNASDEVAEANPESEDSRTIAGFGSSDLDRLKEAASDAPVIRLVNTLLGRAVNERESDLHLEPTPDSLTVRLRTDGRLRTLEPAIPARLRDAVVSRVKLMAGLDIAERRLPKDGRIAHAVRGHEIDFRVATTPTAHGESVVIRAIRSQVQLDFDALGFDRTAMSALTPLLERCTA